VNLFRTAMNALENLIVERWNTQKLLSAISQQSSLQNVATWVVFQKETQDELARVLQVNLSNSIEAHSCLLTKSYLLQDSMEYEVYCRKLPPLSLRFAGIEFKCRVRPKKFCSLACLQRFKGAGTESVRCRTERALLTWHVLNQVAGACVITGLLKRALVVGRTNRRIRRVYNQIEPKLVLSSQNQHISKLAENVMDRRFSCGDCESAQSVDASQSRHSLSDVSPGGLVQARLLAMSPGGRSPSFFGPGNKTLRDAFAVEQASDRHSSSRSISSYPDEVGSDSMSLPSKKSEIEASLDDTTRQVLCVHNRDEIDLRQVFGKDYIQELSANLPAGQGKVTVKTRDGFGNTALHLAAGRGDRLGCHFLVSNGADVAALNNYGRRFFCTSFSCIVARA
jgi:hypothetical protein